jgi:hypothetical protein
MRHELEWIFALEDLQQHWHGGRFEKIVINRETLVVVDSDV